MTLSDTILYENTEFLSVLNEVATAISTMMDSHGKKDSVNDMDMTVYMEFFSDSSFILGSSRVRSFYFSFDDPKFTLSQIIRLNRTYFSSYFQPCSFNDTTKTLLFNLIFHETLHGIGFHFSKYNLTGWGGFVDDGFYIGQHAVNAYREITQNNNLDRIPVENSFGPGSEHVHWEEGKDSSHLNENRYYNSIYHPSLPYEIMTPILDTDVYLTKLTLGVLEDYGYTVHYDTPYMYPVLDSYNLLTIEINDTNDTNYTSTFSNAILNPEILTNETDNHLLSEHSNHHKLLFTCNLLDDAKDVVLYIKKIFEDICDTYYHIHLEFNNLSEEMYDKVILINCTTTKEAMKMTLNIGKIKEYVICNDLKIPKISLMIVKFIILELCGITNQDNYLYGINTIKLYNEIIKDTIEIPASKVPLVEGYSEYGYEYPCIQNDILNKCEIGKEINISYLTLVAIQDGNIMHTRKTGHNFKLTPTIVNDYNLIPNYNETQINNDDICIYTSNGASLMSLLYKLINRNENTIIKEGDIVSKNDIVIINERNVTLDNLFWDGCIELNNRSMFERYEHLYSNECKELLYWRMVPDIEWNIINKICSKEPGREPCVMNIKNNNCGSHYIKFEFTDPDLLKSKENENSYVSSFWWICLNSTKIRLKVNSKESSTIYKKDGFSIFKFNLGERDNVEILNFIDNKLELLNIWFLKENTNGEGNLNILLDNLKDQRWNDNLENIYTIF